MKTILFIFLLFFTSFAYSQGQGLSITYNFSHLLDTNNLSKIHTEMMGLDFDKNGSRYYSETAVIQNEEMKKKVQEAEKESDGTGVYKINMGVVRKVTNQELLLYPKNKKFFIIKKF